MGGFRCRFIDILLREQCVLVYISRNAMTMVEILVILRYKGARTFPAPVDVSSF